MIFFPSSFYCLVTSFKWGNRRVVLVFVWTEFLERPRPVDELASVCLERTTITRRVHSPPAKCALLLLPFEWFKKVSGDGLCMCYAHC